MIFIEYVQSLSDNPYFGTGFGLFGIGATLLKKGIQIGTVLFRCHVVIRERACKRCLSVETSFEQRDTGHVTTKYNFILSIGVHFSRYKENWIKIEGTGEQQTLDLHMGVPWETIQLTAFDKDRSIYFNILEEVEFVQIFTESHYTILGNQQQYS